MGRSQDGREKLGKHQLIYRFKILEWMKESVHTKDGPGLRLKEDNTHRS